MALRGCGARPPLRVLAAVGAGGFIGTLLRFWVGEISGTTGAATLTVNLLGAAALGFLLGWAPWPRRARNAANAGAGGLGAQAFFSTGLLGGFTTYSALALEVVKLPLARGLTYGAATVITGVALATLGIVAGARVSRSRGGAQ